MAWNGEECGIQTVLPRDGVFIETLGFFVSSITMHAHISTYLSIHAHMYTHTHRNMKYTYTIYAYVFTCSQHRYGKSTMKAESFQETMDFS